MRRMLAAMALLLGVTLAAIPACEDDSVFRSGDPPPSIEPDSGTTGGGADDAGTGGSILDAGND